MKTLLISLLFASVAFAKKPNIIVIMADDMGYADAGFTGATDIKTPNLDALAASGVIFKNGYVNHAYCGPSRAALLSGRYQNRFGFETNPAYDPSNPHMGIDVDEQLFPKRLRKAGYTTGVIGKWHLGAATPFHPNKRGFSYFYGFLGGGHDYFSIDLKQPVKEGYLQSLERNGKPADFDGYLTTALSIDAANFINTNKEKPFFLYVAYNAPHAPLQAPKEAIEKYSHIEEKKRRIYAAMVDTMDDGIGKIIASLEKNKLRENTLVFFLSDNGGPQSTKTQPTKWNGSDNTPFRGGKGNLYDGGVHVPFIASWPARIPKGSTYDSPVIAIDISRTAVAAAGGDAQAAPAMEGVDLIPFVLGEKSGHPHSALFWRDASKWSILTSDRTKHLKDHTSPKPQLFELPNDATESNDLIGQKPELAAQLLAQWNVWNKSNIECRLLGYKDYHKKRDEFFRQAIPKAAQKSGYDPKPIPTFK